MLINGDSLEVLKTYPDNHFDSVVTDPPYGLSFMGKKWDYDVPSVELWKEVYRVLKPGGHLLAFAGTRTQHRMAVNIEDAGFEIRDMLAWLYGSGFPKSLNIGKAVDKLQGNERKIVGKGLHSNIHSFADNTKYSGTDFKPNITKGNSKWEGWGTALKPALEPITMARKPFKDSVAENVLKYGVGGLNIDGSRVEHQDPMITRKNFESNTGEIFTRAKGDAAGPSPAGRFPANVIHDNSDEVLALFPETKSGAMNSIAKPNQYNTYGKMYERRVANPASQGSAARFFYVAKASRGERNKGLEDFPDKPAGMAMSDDEYTRNNMGNTPASERLPIKNYHPTVKPVMLMRYLVKLITPKNGLVLDPFNGSGTTGIACKLEHMEYVGIELDPEYVKISQARIDAWQPDNQQSLL